MYKALISKERLTAYMFVMPVALTILLLVVYPVLFGGYISFFETNLVNKWDFVWFHNYTAVFEESEFLANIVRTLWFTLLVVAGHFLFGFIFALLLNQNLRGTTFFRALLILPWLFPDVVIALLWKWMYNPLNGLINGFLSEAGLISEPISWLGSPKTAFAALVIACVWKGYPLVLVQMMAGLQTISADLYEAARIDGANAWKCFLNITLPGLRPVLIVTLILDTVWWFKHFTMIWMLTAGGPGNSTMLASIDIYKSGFEHFEFGISSAMSVYVFLVCVLIGFVFRRILSNDK